MDKVLYSAYVRSSNSADVSRCILRAKTCLKVNLFILAIATYYPHIVCVVTPKVLKGQLEPLADHLE